ncbi:Eukaryotic rRNA processing protein EBP2 family protein [Candida albicans]|uniref:Eukaryotic rRNA processing protein EBP2 family protein n=1 Tax=Candida albicans TaxID=5476 RepID=A0A8H6BVZ9_CANAX|nr:Eukaryotic rRNA processing protein EBP2 family protein [Candida albicans]
MARGILKQQLKSHQLIDAIDKAKSKPTKKTPVTEKTVEEEKEIIEAAPVTTKVKSNKKSKKSNTKKDDDDYQKEEEDDDDDEEELDLEKLAASESESDINDEEEEDDDDDDEEEDDEVENNDEAEDDIPLSDVEVDSDADIVPHTKLTINNMAALRESLARIELPWSKHSFIEHQSITSADKTESEIKDIYDDTERELAFYKQGLDAVKQSRKTLLKLKIPFSRPMDYFAEMVKSDEHMDKLKNKLLTEAANKKASEEAKRQRQLKKFGKQVQHATLQERAKQKKETLEKIKSLKKKRGANEISNDDDFQIALEEATENNQKYGHGGSGSGGDNKRRKPNSKRLAKDAKYGFGGKKRGKRENDAASSADISGFSTRKMKGKSTSRPGKSKRSRRH